MFESLRKINVRVRIVVCGLVISLIFLTFTTPILSWFHDIISKPDQVQNLEVILTVDNIRLNWSKSEEIDLRKYKIIADNEKIDILKDITTYSYNFETMPDKLEFYVEDIFGQSSKVTAELSLDDNSLLDRQVINEDLDDGNVNSFIGIRSVILSILILISTGIVLNFVIHSYKTYVLMFYPAVVILPYILLAFSFLLSERAEFSKFFLSLIFSVLLFLIYYFVVLTTNILNTAMSVKIPLEQAARASQFIFSLIASYLVLILFFGANYSFFEKIILIVPAIFYLSFSAILMIENLTYQRAIIRSLSITFAILYAIFVFSVWPINYVYAILAIAVLFYILLNVSLESRQKLGNHVWVEFVSLVLLIAFLLIINSSWGINGTLI